MSDSVPQSSVALRILVYSNEPMPKKRGLVMIDGVDGEVVGSFLEDNPEDWTDLQDDAAGTAEAAAEK